MFSCTPEVQTELRRHRSPSHRHETNDPCPGEQQAATGAGGGRLGGDPGVHRAVNAALLAGNSHPAKNLSPPESLLDITPEASWLADAVWCYSCSWLASTDRERRREEGSEGAGEREVLQRAEHPTQLLLSPARDGFLSLRRLFGSHRGAAASPAAATFPR